MIRIQELWKEYRLGQGSPVQSSLRELLSFERHPNKRQRARPFWALRDVSLDIQEGEILGVIGPNGAGKSTLLKILSRITPPTRGRVEIRGRIASLLEVGTGFHPDLTGRENVFLNGAILSMSRREIRERFDEIVAFAGVEDFIDTPVKRYSSGMYLRLAFAVAAHLNSDILLVDEVLAVGDASFQAKCLGKVEGLYREGRTVVFVSHNMSAVARLCSHAIWLDHGEIRARGRTRDVISTYLSHGRTTNTVWRPEADSGGPFCFKSVRVLSGDAPPAGPVMWDLPIQIVFEFQVRGPLRPGRLSFHLVNQEGLIVLSSASTDSEASLDRPWQEGAWQLRCEIPPYFLAPGQYSVNVSEPLAAGGDRIYESVLRFSVGRQGSLPARDGRHGIVSPRLSWTLSPLDGGEG